MADADQTLALRACLFSAVGTAGQRCTTLRRLYIQESIYDSFSAKLATGNTIMPPSTMIVLHVSCFVLLYGSSMHLLVSCLKDHRFLGLGDASNR